MDWFYAPTIGQETIEFTLPEDESKHICRVLRYVVGDKLILANGKGSIFHCMIIEDHPKRCRVSVENYAFQEASATPIHIAIAPTKTTERLEWFLEKACEIGVDEITILQTKNTERKQLKLDRLEKVLITATKQTKRYYIPTLNPPSDLKTFVKKHPKGAVAHCFDREKYNLTEIYEKQDFPILIGPEGDFTKEEIDFLLNNNYKSVSLGKNRLRTETAGLYACMQAKYIIDHE